MAERSQCRGLDPELQNEPNFRIFRLGRISYGEAGAGGAVDEVGGGKAVAAKEPVVPGGEMSSNLRLGCHGASVTTRVAGEQGRFRGVGREVIEGERRKKKMFE